MNDWSVLMAPMAFMADQGGAQGPEGLLLASAHSSDRSPRSPRHPPAWDGFQHGSRTTRDKTYDNSIYVYICDSKQHIIIYGCSNI